MVGQPTMQQLRQRPRRISSNAAATAPSAVAAVAVATRNAAAAAPGAVPAPWCRSSAACGNLQTSAGRGRAVRDSPGCAAALTLRTPSRRRCRLLPRGPHLLPSVARGQHGAQQLQGGTGKLPRVRHGTLGAAEQLGGAGVQGTGHLV